MRYNHTLRNDDVMGGYGDTVLSNKGVSTEHVGGHQSYVQSRLHHRIWRHLYTHHTTSLNFHYPLSCQCHWTYSVVTTLSHWLHTWLITSSSAGVRSIVISVSVCLFVCLFVCLSVRSHISKTTSPSWPHFTRATLVSAILAVVVVCVCVCVCPGPDHPWGWWDWSHRARAPIGVRTAQYNENLQSRTRTTLCPEISRDKICGLLKFFALLKFLKSDAFVDNSNVWPGINGRLTYVCSLLHFPKKTLLYVNICTRGRQSLSSFRARRYHDLALCLSHAGIVSKR